jgi:hypothetical protein
MLTPAISTERDVDGERAEPIHLELRVDLVREARHVTRSAP